jgi:serine/threonine protein kinase
MKIKIKKTLSEAISGKLPPPRPKEFYITRTLRDKYNIDIGKELGRGAYGVVYEGISDDYGPVAIKVLDATSNKTGTEIDNYKTISEARSKSPYIKKHFPEVYHIHDEYRRGFVLIIMEILTVDQGQQYETISMLFGGMNTALAPGEDEEHVAGYARSRENRYYMMFKDKESQDSIIQQFHDDMPPELDFLKKTIRNFFSYLDAYVSNKSYSEKAKQLLTILPLSDRADMYLNNWRTGKAKAMFQNTPWMLTFIIEQLDELYKQEDKMLFAQYHERLILFWLEWFRKNSPIGLKDGDKWAVTWENRGSEPEQWAIFKEAASIKRAIAELKDITGLQARDMHDKNVMIRPQTGDIVIMDVGLFSK